MISESAVEKAAATVIAGEIIKAMDSAKRDEVLELALTKALSSYSITSAVEKAVQEQAEQAARQLCKSEYWAGRIKEAVIEGFKLYTDELPMATAKAIAEAMHGKNGENHYDRAPGIVLKRLTLSGASK